MLLGIWWGWIIEGMMKPTEEKRVCKTCCWNTFLVESMIVSMIPSNLHLSYSVIFWQHKKKTLRAPVRPEKVFCKMGLTKCHKFCCFVSVCFARDEWVRMTESQGGHEPNRTQELRAVVVRKKQREGTFKLRVIFLDDSESIFEVEVRSVFFITIFQSTCDQKSQVFIDLHTGQKTVTALCVFVNGNTSAYCKQKYIQMLSFLLLQLNK